MNSVNLKAGPALVAAIALAGCVLPRRAPAVGPGEYRGTVGRDPAATAGVPADAGYRVAWRKGFGRGIVTPLQIHAPVLIVTSTGRRVVIVDAETGDAYWARRFSGPIAGSVLRRNDRIYVATGDRENRITALSLDRGKKAWASRRVGSFRVQPVLLTDRIVGVTDEGHAVAIAEDDGAVLWRTELHAPPAAQPIPDGDDVLVVTVRDTLYRISGADGRILARLTLPGTPSAPPLLLGRRLVVPVEPQHVVTVDVDAMTASPAVRLPTTVLAAPVAGDPGRAFLLARDGRIVRLDLATNTVAPVGDVGGAAAGSFAGVGPLLAVGRLDGTLLLVDRGGNRIWWQDFEDSIDAPVLALDGVMYVPLLHGDVVRLELQ